MIAEGTHTGIFHAAEHQMIEGVLRLPDRTVRSIMMPRGDVVWLDAADSRETVWNAVRTSGHSRYPGLPRPARRAARRRHDRRPGGMARRPGVGGARRARCGRR